MHFRKALAVTLGRRRHRHRDRRFFHPVLLGLSSLGLGLCRRAAAATGSANRPATSAPPRTLLRLMVMDDGYGCYRHRGRRCLWQRHWPHARLPLIRR